MRTGYAIRDKINHCWFHTRQRPDDACAPVTSWIRDESEAMIFNRLPEARRMLDVLKGDSRHPGALVIMSPTWKVIT